jgi:hypothetical protein
MLSFWIVCTTGYDTQLPSRSRATIIAISLTNGQNASTYLKDRGEEMKERKGEKRSKSIADLKKYRILLISEYSTSINKQ